MRGVDYEARNAYKEGKIAKYFTRRDHVLLVFEVNAPGVKVRTKERLFELLAKVEHEGIPESLRAPRDPADPPAPLPAGGGAIVPLQPQPVQDPLIQLLGPQLPQDLQLLPCQLDNFIDRSEALLQRLVALKNAKPKGVENPPTDN